MVALDLFDEITSIKLNCLTKEHAIDIVNRFEKLLNDFRLIDFFYIQPHRGDILYTDLKRLIDQTRWLLDVVASLDEDVEEVETIEYNIQLMANVAYSIAKQQWNYFVQSYDTLHGH